MDAGIIAAIKRRYRKRQIGRALECLSGDSVDLYKVDQLKAMKWIAEIWDELESTIVYNCWCTTGVSNGIESTESLHEEKEMNELESLLNDVMSPRHGISINALLNPAGEDDVIAVCSVEFLVEQITHDLEFQESSVCETHEEASEEPEYVDETHSMCAKDKLKHLGLALRILDSHGTCTSSVRCAVVPAQREIRANFRSSLKQTRITGFIQSYFLRKLLDANHSSYN